MLDDPALAEGAVSDSFTFDPWLLTSGGPDNGRLPTRGDASQIAYGADSRLQSLLATADADGATTEAAHRPRRDRRRPGTSAPTPPARRCTTRPPAGPSTASPAPAQVNRNSGAESTIHGLLSMIALDEHPAVAELARTDGIVTRQGTLTLEAEDGALAGDASATVPPSLWTGESLFSGIRLRRPRQRRVHHDGAARSPALARAPGVRPPAGERRGHPVP